MTPRNKRLAIRIGASVGVVAVIVIVWEIVRAVPVTIFGFAGLGLLVFLALKWRANRRTKVIFGFYVAANEILVDGERSRYHFEIAEIIRTGQRVVKSMPDAPPLSRFALGALYYSIGDYNGAAEQLGFAAEEEILKESRHVLPSRQLRHYVEKLRKIERKKRRWTKTNAAIASLERMHQERAAGLLAESQQHLKRMVEQYEVGMADQARLPRKDVAISSTRSLKSITAPPPISEVLQDIYQEEPKAS
ncbi:MAG TPA: hypothetical protein VIF64_18505 [Pyrinomonadaceae bacterium]|jgi:hypothetical protein